MGSPQLILIVVSAMAGPALADGWLSPTRVHGTVYSDRPASYLPFSTGANGEQPRIGPTGPINSGESDDGVDTVAAPLPGPAALGLGGLALLGARRRRRDA